MLQLLPVYHPVLLITNEEPNRGDDQLRLINPKLKKYGAEISFLMYIIQYLHLYLFMNYIILLLYIYVYLAIFNKIQINNNFHTSQVHFCKRHEVINNHK
jgi:hypothetical protein